MNKKIEPSQKLLDRLYNMIIDKLHLKSPFHAPPLYESDEMKKKNQRIKEMDINNWEKEFDEGLGTFWTLTLLPVPPEYPKLKELIIKSEILFNRFIKGYIKELLEAQKQELTRKEK